MFDIQYYSDKKNTYSNFRSFTADLPLCPCDLEHAVADKGRYMPDPDCDKDSNPTCLYHYGAIHCVLSGTPV